MDKESELWKEFGGGENGQKDNSVTIGSFSSYQ